MTEYEIQDFLYRYARQRNHLNYCPNIYLYNWESDFLTVVKSGFVNEYEIKISKADFKNDTKKTEKHETLKYGGYTIRGNWDYSYYEKKGMLDENKRRKCKRPNYFWYVCPENLIEDYEIPSYAGLIFIKNEICKIEKKAPRLHREKITEYQTKKIMVSLGFKYWNLRTKRI